MAALTGRDSLAQKSVDPDAFSLFVAWAFLPEILRFDSRSFSL